MAEPVQKDFGTKLAKTQSDMQYEKKQQNQLPSWTNYLPSQVAEEVKQAIEETLFRNEATFRLATEENRRFIVQKLVKIFSFAHEKYRITPERVYLLNLRGQVVVSLHYLVYLKLAAEAGVKVLRFERTESGEKVILRHKNDDLEREYYLDYDLYKKRTGVWQTHFDVMFRKTLLKQAIMFLFADIYENELFSQVVNFEEEDLVEPPKIETTNEQAPVSGTVTEPTPTPTPPQTSKHEVQEFRRKNTKLYARINQLIATFIKDKELYKEVQTFLYLNNYKTIYDITNEEDLKTLHAIVEALAEQKAKGVNYDEVMELRDKVLAALHSFSNKAIIKPYICELLAQYGYTTISEIGKLEVLRQILQILDDHGKETTNGIV